MAPPMTRILILYYSRYGSTAALATQIARGVNSVEGASASLRVVPPVSAETEASHPDIPDSGPPFATRADLKDCDGPDHGKPDALR